MNRSKIFALRDSLFRTFLQGLGWGMIALLAATFITLLFSSHRTIFSHGFGFLFGVEWNPISGEFGALPFLVGTLLTSFLALLISLPFSLSLALFLGEYARSGPISAFIRTMVELLAGIPSVIYGFWGLFFLVPIMRDFQLMIGVPPYGVGIFSASVILAIMIIPYSASVAREVISLVPVSLKEAAYSLGSTRFEVISKIILPYARSGIIAGLLLSLGRALGETMAVTMIIGNRNAVPNSIFDPANTMASLIANEFAEATEATYLSALMEIALILLVVSVVINIIGRYVVVKMNKGPKA